MSTYLRHLMKKKKIRLSQGEAQENLMTLHCRQRLHILLRVAVSVWSEQKKIGFKFWFLSQQAKYFEWIFSPFYHFTFIFNNNNNKKVIISFICNDRLEILFLLKLSVKHFKVLKKYFLKLKISKIISWVYSFLIKVHKIVLQMSY